MTKPRTTSIFEANRDQLTNPDLIKLGRVLRVPLPRFVPVLEPTVNAPSPTHRAVAGIR